LQGQQGGPCRYRSGEVLQTGKEYSKGNGFYKFFINFLHTLEMNEVGIISITHQGQHYYFPLKPVTKQPLLAL
jgi:hypothetical protein